MDPETLGQLGGWIGGLVSSLLGILGGIIGTYFTVRNTKGPRERAFAIKASLVCWVLVLSFVAGILLIPSWYKHLLWIPYVVLMILGIPRWNQAQSRIRQQEAGQRG